MSKRKSNKKVKLQILSFLNRNKPHVTLWFGYYTLTRAIQCSNKE